MLKVSKASHPDTLRENLIQRLQSYRQQANDNTLQNIPSRHSKKVYHPLVLAKRAEILSSLCIKHRAKLAANYRGTYGILVATATRMALEQLGLIEGSSRKGFYRLRQINSLKVRLGAQVKNPDKRYTPKKGNISKYAIAAAKMQERDMPQFQDIR